MKNTVLLIIFIFGFSSLKSQNTQNKILNNLINKISYSAISTKYVDKKFGKVTNLENGKYSLNQSKYPNYGIEFMQPVIGQYNILIVDASKFSNFKNNLINFDKNYTLTDFIEKNSVPLNYELIKKDGRRNNDNRLLLKYNNYEIQSTELSDQEIDLLDIINIDTNLLKKLKINSIWFIYNDNTPPSPIMIE
jgi:hypothetical protein